jgi:hypothetical protein
VGRNFDLRIKIIESFLDVLGNQHLSLTQGQTAVVCLKKFDVGQKRLSSTPMLRSADSGIDNGTMTVGWTTLRDFRRVGIRAADRSRISLSEEHPSF